MSLVPLCDRNDVESVYGRQNVLLWSDLDNNRNSVDIQNRVVERCADASEEVYSLLILGRYAVPFARIPRIIKFIASLRTGLMLYDGRQMVTADGRDQVSRQRKQFDRYIRQIKSGQLKLIDPLDGEAIPLTCYNAPVVAVTNSCSPSATECI